MAVKICAAEAVTARFLTWLDAADARRFAAVLALVALVVRGSGFFLSFYSGDEATYSALARRILAGAVPYASAVDHKPVAIELVYAAIYALPGDLGLRGVRALFVLVVYLTALVLGSLTRQVSAADGLDAGAARRAGRLAALCYVLASAWGFASDVQAANTELLLDLPIALGALLYWRALRRPSVLEATLAGVLVGLAGLCKYQAALIGGAFAAFGLITANVSPGRTRRATAAIALGFTAVALVYVGFFRASGNWDAFTYWGWRFNFAYMSILSTQVILWNAATRTAWVLLMWAPLWMGGRAMRLDERRHALALVVPWASMATLAIAFGGRFFPHYYLMALPPLVVWAAPGLVRLLEARRARSVLLAAGLVTTASLVMAWGWYALKPSLRRSSTAYRAVGAYLRAHGAPDDRVFVWGNSPEIYELSGLRMGTRFPFCNYHTGLIWGSPLYDDNAPGAEAHIVARAWTELLADLDAAPPAFIVDAAAGGLDHFERHPSTRYRPLASVIAESYVLDAIVAAVPVYRRRDLVAGPAAL